MTDTTYFCPYCRARMDDGQELPYVTTCNCSNCERPFAIVAFEVDDERFYCCLPLNERTMESSDIAAKVEYVIRLAEPYLPLMGVPPSYREMLRIEMVKRMTGSSHEVMPEEFIEEGLYHSDAHEASAVNDWRTEWVCECRYCGCEITSGRSVFPPSFRFKGDCPGCHKRLEVRVTYPNRNLTLPQALQAPARLIAPHPLIRATTTTIGDDEICDFTRLLRRKDLGFPGGFKNK